MRTWREYIDSKRDEWIGKKVFYMGEQFTVVNVDYNGSLMIDKPTQFNATTAISENMIDK